jgi:TonB family protein
MIPVVRALFISFLVHILFMVGMALFVPATPARKEIAEIDIIEPKHNDKIAKPQQQIVRQAFVPEKLKAPQDDELARFLSQQKQRVKKESQAAEAGMTENRENALKQQQQKEQKQRQQQTRAPLPEAKDGYREVDISREMSDMSRLQGGVSRVGESLPTDVRVGSFTALNTDRYTFYTFYARIEELVRFRWETQVGRAIDSFDRNTLLQASDRNWVTQVEFILDARGELKQAIIMKASGIKQFDMAAVNAFREARIFPNPPREMVEEDGFIHLKYGFNVNYRPPAMAIR